MYLLLPSQPRNAKMSDLDSAYAVRQLRIPLCWQETRVQCLPRRFAPWLRNNLPKSRGGERTLSSPHGWIRSARMLP